MSLILLAISLTIMLCIIAYNLAIYALPFMVGLTAAQYAWAAGAGLFDPAVEPGLIGGNGFEMHAGKAPARMVRGDAPIFAGTAFSVEMRSSGR